MYACLECGFVYKEQIKKDDVKQELLIGGFMCPPQPERFGKRTYRQCPKCKEIYTIKIKWDNE